MYVRVRRIVLLLAASDRIAAYDACWRHSACLPGHEGRFVGHPVNYQLSSINTTLTPSSSWEVKPLVKRKLLLHLLVHGHCQNPLLDVFVLCRIEMRFLGQWDLQKSPERKKQNPLVLFSLPQRGCPFA